jgi:hypothetical protein
MWKITPYGVIGAPNPDFALGTPLQTRSGRLGGFGGAAVGAHVDPAAVGRRLLQDRLGGIARVDARTAHIVPDPASAGRVAATGRGLQVIVRGLLPVCTHPASRIADLTPSAWVEAFPHP